MPVWLLSIVGFFRGMTPIRWVGIILVGLLTIGINYKLFVKPDTKINVKSGGVYNACQAETPIMGCSIWKVKLKAIWQ